MSSGATPLARGRASLAGLPPATLFRHGPPASPRVPRSALPRHRTRERAQADRARRPRPRRSGFTASSAPSPASARSSTPYCLMGNHFHLLVETSVPNLARGMRGATAPSSEPGCTGLTRSSSRSATSTSATKTSPAAGAGAQRHRARSLACSESRFAVRSRNCYASEATSPLHSPTARATRCENSRPSSACTTRRSAAGPSERSARSASLEVLRCKT